MTGIELAAAIEAALILGTKLANAVLAAQRELERARAAGVDAPLDPAAIRPLLEALTNRDAELSAKAHKILAELEAQAR